MGKAEVGSTKHLSNQMKAKGLQRLRWYCQPCERQMRDDNAFKQHCMSESHVRQMLVVGEDPKKFLREYSDQFLRDFVSLLKTGHRDKQVQINHFYQEYIANKAHVHMNSTQWSSLTEFAKHLGREGICRVEENDKGIHIAWIDDSPEALKRQEALRRKEAQDRGDEEWEQRMLKAQIKRAQKDAATRTGAKEGDEEEDKDEGRLLREGDVKIKLSIGAVKPGAAAASKDKPPTNQPPAGTSNRDANTETSEPAAAAAPTPTDGTATAASAPDQDGGAANAKPVTLKLGIQPQKKNVFAAAKKNALGGGAKKMKIAEPKKMSEAERIMRQEMERKRPMDSSKLGSSNKRPRF
ncbi:zinc finger protein RTS2 [Gaeumannomyces tritici R3-111a-1]|uniref:Zinc finger protein RTS2 n=1 Tax=Gaeumannomyces tritici (strain R3-111a-1) TaxID=644352 RepID=J3NXZ5_GAET3|nr:zinc finger protein RTS2 [Gaeumannomyces tritici R3-111a-1]EJT76228.1 zinc finger protein RTS2 [Gaeumannomyces tritici R3-111a-1]